MEGQVRGVCSCVRMWDFCMCCMFMSVYRYVCVRYCSCSLTNLSLVKCEHSTVRQKKTRKCCDLWCHNIYWCNAYHLLHVFYPTVSPEIPFVFTNVLYGTVSSSSFYSMYGERSVSLDLLLLENVERISMASLRSHNEQKTQVQMRFEGKSDILETRCTCEIVAETKKMHQLC